LFNVAATGVTMKIDTSLAGNLLAPGATVTTTGVLIGIIIAGDMPSIVQINKPSCPPIAVVSQPEQFYLCPTFEDQCLGYAFPMGDVEGSFKDFNVVSFSDFNANTGDVEGRLSCRNNLNLGAGYSVGASLDTINGVDRPLPYSVVAGGNCNFVSGDVYPDGTNSPNTGDEEGMFVGQNFTGASYLADRVTGSCGTAGAGCLNTYFDAALSCYQNLQSIFASSTDTATVTVQWDALILTCENETAVANTATITGSQLASSTYYVLDNCFFQSAWILNIPGTDDITLSGGSFPAIGGGVLYNVLGSGRTIYVNNTAVTGSILSPGNTLYQVGGYIAGKVVVDDVAMALQINIAQCANPEPVTIYGVTSQPSDNGDNSLNVVGDFQPGDSAIVGGTEFTVTATNEGTITISPALGSSIPAGTQVSSLVDGSKARTPINNGTAPTSPSSSDSFSVSVNVCVAVFCMLIVALLF